MLCLKVDLVLHITYGGRVGKYGHIYKNKGLSYIYIYIYIYIYSEWEREREREVWFGLV